MPRIQAWKIAPCVVGAEKSMIMRTGYAHVLSYPVARNVSLCENLGTSGAMGGLVAQEIPQGSFGVYEIRKVSPRIPHKGFLGGQRK